MVKTKKQIELEYAEHLEKELGVAVEEIDALIKDITIICKDKKIPAQSSVLKLGSLYFRNLLTDEIVDSVSRNVDLCDVDTDGLETTLKFLYSGKIDTDDGDVDQVKTVLKTAHFLEVDVLCTYCWQAMTAKLSDQYFAELWQLGLLYNDHEFIKGLICYLARKFTRAASSTDFVNLSAYQLEQLLQHSDLNASVDTLVTSLLNWTKEAPSERCGHLSKMLIQLDLSALTNTTLGHVLENNLVKNSRDLFNIFRPVVTGRLRKIQPQRFFTGNNLLCFRKLKKGTREESVFSIYNIEKEVWTQTKRLPVDLDEETIVTSDGDQIFFISKSTDESDAMVIQEFSPAYNAIMECGYVKQILYGPGAAVVKDKLYIIGGSRNMNFVNPSLSVYSYDRKTRRSSEVAALSEPCIDPIVVNIDDSLFAVGRCDKFPSVLQRYSPIPNQWTKLRTLPESVTKAVTWRKKLYLILRRDTQFEVFDHMIDLWYTEEIKEGPAIVTGLWNLESTGKQKARLLFRGEDFALSCYNLSAGEWDTCRNSVCADDCCLSVHDVVF